MHTRLKLRARGELIHIWIGGVGPGRVTLYLVEDVATWTDGMTIGSPDVTVVQSANGYHADRVIWDEMWGVTPVPGKYDLVMDVDDDGVYDEGIDALDDSDMVVTAGFLVVPEEGPILYLVACIAALTVFSRLRSLHSVLRSSASRDCGK